MKQPVSSSVETLSYSRRKMGTRRKLSFFLLIFFMLLTLGSSVLPAHSGGIENPDKETWSEEEEQYVTVNKSVDCKGTKVTIEKILLDKTHTFMIADVDGDIQGRMDTLTVDLFADQGQELGRSLLLHNLPNGKTLLTFDTVRKVPVTLTLEFFGGPVGYGGNVTLILDDIIFKTVDEQFTRDYRLAEYMEKNGYRLEIDSIVKGINETSLSYQLTTLGDYDGIEHGWLYNYWRYNYPQILFMSDSGHNLEPHLSNLTSFGPSYRVSQDGKAIVGRAYFEKVLTTNLQVNLTNIYGYYRMNEIIPIDVFKDNLDINRTLQVDNYSIYLSLTRDNEQGTLILDYSVLDSAGNNVDAAVEAGIYMKADNYRMLSPISINLPYPDCRERQLVFNWQPLPENRDGLLEGAALKITKLGIKQEDSVVNINLAEPNKPVENRDETEIMVAINKYYATFGQALKRNDLAVFAQEYGDLQPTGQVWNGVNDWQREFQVWSPLEIKDYSVSLNDPILTIAGSTAIADIAGQEKISRKGGWSGAVFSTVIYLEKKKGKWKITKVDALTDAEIDGVH